MRPLLAQFGRANKPASICPISRRPLDTQRNEAEMRALHRSDDDGHGRAIEPAKAEEGT